MTITTTTTAMMMRMLMRMLVIQVMMKDLVTPVAVDEIRNVVRKCLENAALINYTKVNETARSEGETDMFNVADWRRVPDGPN